MGNSPHFVKTSQVAPHLVITHEGSLHGEDTPENREIVRRIHACVNACEGISLEELERGIVQDMRRVIGEVAPLLKEKVADNDQPAVNPAGSPPSVKRSVTANNPAAGK